MHRWKDQHTSFITELSALRRGVWGKAEEIRRHWLFIGNTWYLKRTVRPDDIYCSTVVQLLPLFLEYAAPTLFPSFLIAHSHPRSQSTTMLEKLTRTRWWKYLRRFKYPPELKYPPKCAYPTEFDNVPAARAWLYSRVKATPVQFFPSENESRLPVHNRNERSRPLHDPNKLLEPGHVREWTFQNLIAAGHILWYLFLKITNLFQSEMRLRTTIYLVHQLLCCAESGFR